MCVCDCSACPVLLLCLCTPVAAGAGESLLLEGWQDVWVFRFFLNILGYSSIIIPGYLLIRYFKRINYIETGVLNNVFLVIIFKWSGWQNFILRIKGCTWFWSHLICCTAPAYPLPYHMILNSCTLCFIMGIMHASLCFVFFVVVLQAEGFVFPL